MYRRRDQRRHRRQSLAEHAHCWCDEDHAGRLHACTASATASTTSTRSSKTGAGNLCFKGWVLGDARTSVFEGAKLDLVSASEPSRSSLDSAVSMAGVSTGFSCSAIKTLRLGLTEHHAAGTRAANGGWASEGGLYRFPRADHFAQSAEGAPACALHGDRSNCRAPRCSGCSRIRAAISGCQRSQQRRGGLFRWEPHDGRVRDLADAPGAAVARRTRPPRSFRRRRLRQHLDRLSRRAGSPRSMGVFTAVHRLGGAASRRDQEHARRPSRAGSGSPLRRAGSIRVDEPGARATGVRHLHDSERSVEQQRRGRSSKTRRGHLYVGGRSWSWTAWIPPPAASSTSPRPMGCAPGRVVAVYRDRHGVLWFGTSDRTGTARARPRRVGNRRHPLSSRASRSAGVPERVSAFGGTGDVVSGLPAAPKPSADRLPRPRLRVRRGPAVTNTSSREADADWSPLSQQRTVTYASLASGRYTFAVRAVNSDGILSVTPASVTLRDPPPGLAATVVHCTRSARDCARYRMRYTVTASDARSRWPTCGRELPPTCMTTSGQT